MYKILGGDGKEYGPVTAENLRQWMAEGRANAQTQVQAEGTGVWVALGSLPEFAAAGTAPGMTPYASLDPGAARQKALALANPAGIALMVIGALGIGWIIIQAVLLAVRGLESNPFIEGFMSSQRSASPEAARIGMIIGIVISLVLSAAMGGFIILSGLKLRRLQSWGLVLTGAILTLIPCCSSSFPVCFLSLPVGVWVLIVICRREVKSQFT